jgi:chromosomal replication initiation ATPase DnaA
MEFAVAGPSRRRRPKPGTADTQEQREGPPAEHLRGLIEQTVAAAFEVEPALLRLPTRGNKRIALARQVSMYMAHVCCGMCFTDIGRAFARDRSTVAYACHLIEQRRDDREFDRAVELLEGMVRLLAGMWPTDS